MATQYIFAEVPGRVLEGEVVSLEVLVFDKDPSINFLYWKIVSANSPAINPASKFSTLTGTVSIVNNSATIVLRGLKSNDLQTIPIFFNVEVYSNNLRTQLVLSTAPAKIEIEDVYRSGGVSFTSLPTNVVEGNTYTINVSAPGMADGSQLLAGVYVQGRSTFLTEASSAWVDYGVSTALAGTSSNILDFNNLGWENLSLSRSTSGGQFFKIPFVIVSGKGIFQISIAQDFLLEDPTREYFSIDIFDARTTSDTDVYPIIGRSGKINILDDGAVTNIDTAFNGTVSWDLSFMGSGFANSGGAKFGYGTFTGNVLTRNIQIRTTGAGGGIKLYWEIWFEVSDLFPDKRGDGMYPRDFAATSGSFITTASGFGTFAITVLAMPFATIQNWKDRFFQFRIRESPNGRILLSTTGKHIRRVYYVSLQSFNSAQPNYANTSISATYWRPIPKSELNKFNTYSNSYSSYGAIAWDPLFANYVKGDVVSREIGGTLNWTYGVVTAGTNGRSIGATPTISDTLNKNPTEDLALTKQLFDLGWYSADFGIRTPFPSNDSGQITIDNVPVANSSIIYLNEGQTLKIKRNTRNMMPGMGIRWALTTLNTNTETDFYNIFDLNGARNMAQVAADGTITITVPTIQNYYTALGTQSFKVDGAWIAGTTNPITFEITDSTTGDRTAATNFVQGVYVSGSTYRPINEDFDIVVPIQALKLKAGDVIRATVVSGSVQGINYTLGTSITLSNDNDLTLTQRILNGAVYVIGFRIYSSTNKLLFVKEIGVKNASGVSYTLPTPYQWTVANMGIAIYDEAKNVAWSTNAVTWNQIDIFTLPKPTTISNKNYSTILSGVGFTELVAQQILINAPPLDRPGYAYSITTNIGGSVQCSQPNGGEAAYILVFAR